MKTWGNLRVRVDFPGRLLEKVHSDACFFVILTVIA